MNEQNVPCAKMTPKNAEKIFFSKVPSIQAKALAMCAECTIRSKCLQLALDNEITYGIFGGMTASDREAMLNEINSCFQSAGTAS